MHKPSESVYEFDSFMSTRQASRMDTLIVFRTVQNPITKYLQSLKATAFYGATLRSLLEMSSGAKWNENCEERESDFNHLMSCYYVQKPGCALAYLSKLPREENLEQVRL
jgi:hypothetical protein